MGYFKGATEPKVIQLPSNPDYWVKVATDIRWGLSKQALQVGENGELDMIMSADRMLLNLIQEWNLDDDSGNIMPITQENIDKLDANDAISIITIATEERAEIDTKKKSS